MSDHPATRPASAGDDERRPLSLLIVSSWDLLLATGLALFALSVFDATREVRGRTVPIPLAVQIVQALAYAALAAALILIVALMTRRARWVRRAQIAVLLMHMVLVSVGLVVAVATDEGARSLGIVLGNLAVALVDLLALVALTGDAVRRWFTEPGEVPVYVGGLVAFWGAATTAFFVLGLLS